MNIAAVPERFAILRFGSFILLTLICHTPSKAQNLPAGYDVVSKMQQQVWMDKKLAAADPNYSNVNGTPYIFEKFRIGNFYFSNKTCITARLINYNSYTDQVLFSDENTIYLAASQDIEWFTITGSENGSMLLFKQVFLSSEKKRVFMQVLYQGESFLFKRYRKEFLKADVGKPYGSNRQVDEYNDYYEYYISKEGKEPLILKPRKSSVLEIFSDKSDLVEDFINNEKINLKDEADLVKLVKYYDNI